MVVLTPRARKCRSSLVVYFQTTYQNTACTVLSVQMHRSLDKKDAGAHFERCRESERCPAPTELAILSSDQASFCIEQQHQKSVCVVVIDAKRPSWTVHDGPTSQPCRN